MPAKSAKQYRLMTAIAHGSLPATGGLTKKTAEEMVHNTPSTLRSQYSKKKKK